MKFRLLALTLALAALTGCASMLQRSYSSSEKHVEYTVSQDSSSLRAETYRGLVDAILYFVNEHVDQGVIRLYNYTSDVEADLAAACLEVTTEDPLAAFAVADISYEFSRIVSYYEVTLSLTFSRTVEEIEALQLTSGTSGLQSKIREAVAAFSPTLLLRTSYFTGDGDAVLAMVAQAYYDTPTSAFGMPEVAVSIYPETGSQRIVAIELIWPADRATLLQQSAALIRAAGQLLADSPPVHENYTPEELTTLLMDSLPSVDPKGASDPLSALSGLPADQLSHILALELLFQCAGLDATLVTGFADGVSDCWLIVATEDGHRHLPFPQRQETPAEPEDPPEEDPELPSQPEVLLYTDLEMKAMGYLWNEELYPACVDYSLEVSAPSPEDSQPIDGEADGTTSAPD